MAEGDTNYGIPGDTVSDGGGVIMHESKENAVAAKGADKGGRVHSWPSRSCQGGFGFVVGGKLFPEKMLICLDDNGNYTFNKSCHPLKTFRKWASDYVGDQSHLAEVLRELHRQIDDELSKSAEMSTPTVEEFLQTFQSNFQKFLKNVEKFRGVIAIMPTLEEFDLKLHQSKRSSSKSSFRTSKSKLSHYKSNGGGGGGNHRHQRSFFTKRPSFDDVFFAKVRNAVGADQKGARVNDLIRSFKVKDEEGLITMLIRLPEEDALRLIRNAFYPGKTSTNEAIVVQILVERIYSNLRTEFNVDQQQREIIATPPASQVGNDGKAHV